MKQVRFERQQQELERDLLIQQAMAHVDAGRVVDHEEVLEWALRLGSDDPLPMPKPSVRRRTMIP